MPCPLLVIQHEDECPPGRLADLAQARGLELEVVRPYAGERLPTTLSRYGGLIVLGGEMGAYDDTRHPWLTETKALIVRAVVDDVPFLGICLGHQLAAVALGGTVALSPHGPATGPRPVGRTDAGARDLLTGRLPQDAQTVQWNDDVVLELPPDAVLLAADTDGAPQAVRYAPHAWGLQSHPEITRAIFERWSLDKPSASGRHSETLTEAAARVHEALPQIDAQWTAALTAYLDLAATPSR